MRPLGLLLWLDYKGNLIDDYQICYTLFYKQQFYKEGYIKYLGGGGQRILRKKYFVAQGTMELNI